MWSWRKVVDVILTGMAKWCSKSTITLHFKQLSNNTELCLFENVTSQIFSSFTKVINCFLLYKMLLIASVWGGLVYRQYKVESYNVRGRESHSATDLPIRVVRVGTVRLMGVSDLLVKATWWGCGRSPIFTSRSRDWQISRASGGCPPRSNPLCKVLGLSSGAPFFGQCQWDLRNFGECCVHLHYGPILWPTLKRALCHTRAFGRTLNTARSWAIKCDLLRRIVVLYWIWRTWYNTANTHNK